MASPPSRMPRLDLAPAPGSPFAMHFRPDRLLERLLTLLELRPDDLVVQLGCAFADHLLALTELAPLRHQVLVVDPSPDRLARFAGRSKIRPAPMAALRFAAYPMQCDRILLEEALLRNDAGGELARGLFARLRPGGRLLAVGAPRTDVRSPVCVGNGSHPSRALRRAGFELRREAAEDGGGRVDLLLGVKPARS